MTSLFERFERSEIELFHLNQIVDIGHVWLCPRWAVTKATRITSFIERVLRLMVLGVPKEDKYLKTGSIPQV